MKSFIRRLPFATEVPAYTSRKISTRNQVVCSFFRTLSSLLYFCPRCLLSPGNAIVHILRGPKYAEYIIIVILYTLYIQRGVNWCIIHGMYIHNIIFTQTTLAEHTREACAKKVRFVSSSLFRWQRRRGTRGSGLL